MSWELWTVTGYGIDLSETGLDKTIMFIKKHMESTGHYKASIQRAFLDTQGKYADKVYDSLCECTDQVAAGDIIAEIIYNETGIPVYSTGVNEDCKEAILYPEKYPWEMTEKEKTLTEEAVHQMFERYAQELADKPLFVGEQKLYFCG